MRLRSICGAIALLGAASAASAGSLHDVDVILDVHDGAVRTNEVVGADETAPERVFDADMFAFFGSVVTDDPGFNSGLDALPPQSLLELRFVDALRIWNGADFDEVAPVRLELERGQQLVESPTAPGAESPDLFMLVSSFGDLHVHVEHFLPGDADPGIYLASYRMGNDAGLDDSETFYFVYRWEPEDGDEQTAEAEQQAAIQWVRDNLISTPCPADLSGDGQVGALDLGALIAGWGQGGETDLSGDGITGALDLGVLISAWGDCD